MTDMLSRARDFGPTRLVRPKRRKRPVKPVMVGGGLVVAAAVLFWLVWYSPVLAARSVEVQGTKLVTVAQVEKVAAVPKGQPLAKMDVLEIARRVETIAEVADAKVSVSYPSTVVIVVVERRPIGYIVSGRSTILVDEEGVQFRTVTSTPRGLPRFEIPAGPSGVESGKAVAAISASLPEPLRAKLASVHAIDPRSVTLKLVDGRIVHWGSAERSADKAQILPTLLAQPGTQYDVSNPDLVRAR